MQQATLTHSRLPQRAFRPVEPSVGPQIAGREATDREATESTDNTDNTDNTEHPARREKLKSVERAQRRGSAAVLGNQSDEDAPLSGQAPLWLVDPPEPVRVLPGRQRGGWLRLWRQMASEGPRRILRFGGPWKLVDPTALATGEPLRRDYYHVETEAGGAYLVYWECVADAWFVQGILDERNVQRVAGGRKLAGGEEGGRRL